MSGAESSQSLHTKSGCKVERESVIIWRTSSRIMSCVPDTAACVPSVEVSAPASGGAEARSGTRAHRTRARAGRLVGDDVDPHPHVGQALWHELALQI